MFRKLLGIICLLSCLCSQAQAQQQWTRDDLMRYAGNVHQFNQIFAQEKVWLMFDNTSYFQGETIWFKAFVVNASKLTRARSTVLYVDLLSPNGVLLQQLKLKIRAGQADGCFNLMDGSVGQARELRGLLPYPSGYYEVRAYTQYMLNFSPGIVFSRVLPVFKTPFTEGDYTNPVFEPYKSETENYRPDPAKAKDVNVAIFPEGGCLIKGKRGRLAFKATDADGNPVKGRLVISGDRTMGELTAETVHDGMGSIVIPEDYWKSLKAEFDDGTKRYKVNLPKAEDKGYAVMLDRTDDSLLVDIIKGEKARRNDMAVTVTCRGELIGYERVEEGSGRVSLASGDWPLGVCQLTLYTDRGNILSTRFFFNHRSDFKLPQLTAEFDRKDIAPYAPVTVSFKLRDKYGQPFRDRFAVAVRDANSAATAYADDLATSLLLSSDLKGLINDPQYYFESDDEEHREAMDLLMMVQGWERYDWMYMSNNRYFVEKHRLEDSISVNGWITSVWNDKKKLEGVNTYVSIVPLDNDSVVEYGMYTTEDIGYFGFNTIDFYGGADLVVLLEKDGDRGGEMGAKIKLERAERPEVRPFERSELNFSTKAIKGRILFPERKDEPYEKDPETDAIKLPEVEITAPRKYIDYFTFKAYDVEKDVELELDFGEYPTDLLGYLLGKGYTVSTGPFSGIGISDSVLDSYSSGSQYENFAFDGGQGMVYLSRYPTFWYIHDSQKLAGSYYYSTPLSIDTEDIVSVLVFDDPAYITDLAESVPIYMEAIRSHNNISAGMAMRGMAGNPRYTLVDVLLKDEHKIRTKEEKRNKGQRITTLRGFDYPVQFYSPQYPDGPIEERKDFRRTLYWNPNVITDSLGCAHVEFYNNSYSTNFTVTGAGITASGTPYVLDEDF